jgi:hypothetical protein
MVIAKVSERLAVSNQAAQKFDGVEINLRKLNELEVWEQYQAKISHSCAALENLSDSENINRAWENIKENIKTSAKVVLGLHGLNQRKPWVDEECCFLDQKKQASSQSNVHNLNNVKRETCRHIRNKKTHI